MAGDSVLALFIICLMTAILMETNSGLRIDINPPKYVEKLTSGPLNITCSVDQKDAGAQNVFLIEIEKDEESPMLLLQKGGGISYGTQVLNHTQYRVDGSIDDDVSKSFLSLSLLSPDSSDQGIYTCIMYFIDASGMKEHRARKNVTIEKLNDTVIRQLLDKIYLLENKLEDQSKRVVDLLTILEERTWNQSKEMTRMADQGSTILGTVATLEEGTQNQTTYMLSRLADQDALLAKVASTETNLLDKMAKLEVRAQDQSNQLSRLEDKDSKVSDRVDKLEETTGSQSSQISDLVDQDSKFLRTVVNLEEKLQNQTDQKSRFVDQDSGVGDKITDLEERTKNQSTQMARLAGQVIDRVSAVEDQVKGQTEHIDALAEIDSKILYTMAELQEKTENQSSRISLLDAQVTYVSSFSATFGAKYQPSRKDVIVFDSVIMRQGEGYDETTGIFTAPRAGLYAFHVAMATRCTSCNGSVSLRADGEIVAVLWAGDQDYDDQSSISSVVSLKQSDQVKVTMGYSKGDLYWDKDKWSLFTGYCIKVL